jgi:hypothetical protein
VLTLTGPVILIELDVVEAVIPESAIGHDKRRAIPSRRAEADGRLELDGRILVRPADVIGADLAAYRHVDGAIRRAYGTDPGRSHGRGQAALLGTEHHDEPADSEREDQHQDGSRELFRPVLHPPE